jgi:hypothetical protein
LDFRDTLFGLAALYLASVNAGIQPASDFIAVGLISSSKSAAPGGSSTKAMLTEFEKSLFFEETVATNSSLPLIFAKDSILRSQIFVPQQQFLVHGPSDVR